MRLFLWQPVPTVDLLPFQLFRQVMEFLPSLLQAMIVALELTGKRGAWTEDNVPLCYVCCSDDLRLADWIKPSVDLFLDSLVRSNESGASGNGNLKKNS